jgi:uncharacterized protein YeaO (DUF488 family)
MALSLALKRIYEPPEPADGYRVLVDRLWPRGMRKETAALDEWARDVAPSDALRRWFHAHPTHWSTFEDRYRKELDGAEHRAILSRLHTLARQRHVTLLYAVRDEAQNHAKIIADVLNAMKARS